MINRKIILAALCSNFGLSASSLSDDLAPIDIDWSESKDELRNMLLILKEEYGIVPVRMSPVSVKFSWKPETVNLDNRHYNNRNLSLGRKKFYVPRVIGKTNMFPKLGKHRK